MLSKHSVKYYLLFILYLQHPLQAAIPTISWIWKKTPGVLKCHFLVKNAKENTQWYNNYQTKNGNL
jgi:hypothetical protein